MKENAQRDSFQLKLHAFLQVSRANLLLASIGHATLGMFLAAGSLSNLFSLEAGFFIILHYNIALFGCNVNSYFDYDVDRLYKNYMADGVDIIGRSTLRLFIIIEGIIALFLIMMFFYLGYVIVSLLALIGLVGALLYSAEPVRIKKHGLLSPIPVLILYSFPLFGGWFLFQSSLSLVFVVFVIGYMLMNEGFTLVNTCEDYTEDNKKGIVTWAHIFGLQKTLLAAFVFSLSGLLCVVSLGIVLFQKFQDSSLLSFPAVICLFFTVLLIGKASFEVRNVSLGDDLEERAKRYGVRLQRWFMMTRYPLMITAFLILL